MKKGIVFFVDVDNIQFKHAISSKTEKVLKYLKTIGKVIIFSEGDDKYQKAKIVKSGLLDQVDKVLLFKHKLDHLDKIIKRYKGNYLVFLDDKCEFLGKIKEKYPAVFTIGVCQGHFCRLDHKAHWKLDKKIHSIDELLNFTSDVSEKTTKKRILKKTKKIPLTPLILVKPAENPIISPREENGWEAWQTFNPGVILLENKIHFLYRAIGCDGLSRLGYACSVDGFSIEERLSTPAYTHKVTKRSSYFYPSGGSFGGVEDPRIVRVDKEDSLYMTYTACDGGLRVALTSINVNDFLQKKWKWKAPKLISSPNAVHKNWVIFPEKIHGQYAILHSINPEILVDYFDDLEFSNTVSHINSYHNGSKSDKNCWETWVRGVGPVPIKTKYGWLIFYHAMDDDWSKYKLGAMLLDLNDPSKVLTCAKEPILEPNKAYENNGFKSGVIYASGAVVKDNKLLVYYGAADSYVGIAYGDFDKFLEALKSEKKSKLETKVIKKKAYA